MSCMDSSSDQTLKAAQMNNTEVKLEYTKKLSYVLKPLNSLFVGAFKCEDHVYGIPHE